MVGSEYGAAAIGRTYLLPPFRLAVLTDSTVALFPQPAHRTGHLWTPPSTQGKTCGLAWRVVGCCHLSGLGCGRTTAAGLHGSSRTGSKSPKACSKHSGKPW